MIPDDSPYCCYCGMSFEAGRVMTKDHLIALSRGGRNEVCNKRNCCRLCNSAKGSKYPEQFLAEVARKHLRLKQRSRSLPNPASQAQIYHYEIMIENIGYVVDYVISAGEKLFINKYWYEDYIPASSFALQQFISYKNHKIL